MPIPSRFLQVEQAGPVRVPRQIPTVQLVGGNGDAVWLTGADGGFDLLAERGLFAVPDPGVQLKDGAGDGARWAGSRRPARSVDLNVQVRGSTGVEFRSRLARLADILDDRHGMATLRAVTEYDTREMRVLYTSGWDGSGSGFLWQNIPFTVTAPDPFWQSTMAQTVVWSSGTGKPFLSPSTAFFPVQLATTTRVFGASTFTNPGDVSSPALWTITGPGSSISVTKAGGSGFALLASVDALTTITVDTGARTVRDQTGANRYDLLAAAPNLWAVPPGKSDATVAVSSVTTGTSVTLTWFPRYKLAA